MQQTIRIGSRESKLAIAQTQLVMQELRRQHPQFHWELVPMKTTGDRILDRTLDQIGGKGLFVKELDQALSRGEIDFAVHSLKDMPMQEAKELPIAAFFRRGDPRDALVLPESGISCPACIGSSSARRRLQLLRLFPGVQVESIRGNVLTRLNKLEIREVDALVLAAAGLQRLGLAHRISRYFPVTEMLPAAGQGILAVQSRRGERETLLACLDDPDTRTAALAERSFVRALDGGCSSPVAAYAQVSGNEIKLTGLYWRSGETYWVDSRSGPRDKAEQIGNQLAERMQKEAV